MTPSVSNTLRRRLSATVLTVTAAASIATSQPQWTATDSLYIDGLVLDEQSPAVGFTAEVQRKRPNKTPHVDLNLQLRGDTYAPESSVVRVYRLSAPWDGALDDDLQPILPEEAELIAENTVRGTIGDEAQPTFVELYGPDLARQQSTVHLVVAFEDGTPDWAGHLEVSASAWSDESIPEDAVTLDLFIDAGPGAVTEDPPVVDGGAP